MFLSRCTWICTRILVASLLFSTPAWALETIYIRSGHDGVSPLAGGAQWTQAHVTDSNLNALYPLRNKSFSMASGFFPNYFRRVLIGPSPRVVSEYAFAWLPLLPDDNQARWIHPKTHEGEGLPANSALYAIPFHVSTPTIGAARLTLSWIVDDVLGDPRGHPYGDPNIPGVYVNEQPVTEYITGGGFMVARTETRSITALVHPGDNVLYIYQRDLQGLRSGLIFSARIDICDPPISPTSVTIRSGSVNGATGSPGAIADQFCKAGSAEAALKGSLFNSWDYFTVSRARVAGGPWSVPTDMDPAARWINWSVDNQNRLFPAASALYRSPFYLDIPTYAPAILTFRFAADNRLGDPSGGANTAGVYLNRLPLPQPITGGSRSSVTTVTQQVTVRPGWNNLFVYGRDVHDPEGTNFSGVIFSAQLDIQGRLPCWFGMIAGFTPAVREAYPIAADLVRVVFDREVTRETAENPNNYALASLGSVDGASLDESGRAALLRVSGTVSSGNLDGISVSGIAAADTLDVMNGVEFRSYVAGVLTVADIQQPTALPLSGRSVPRIPDLCDDRSPYAGTGETVGPAITVSGVFVGGSDGTFSLMDETGTIRRGILASGISEEMIRGHRYRVTGYVQESEGQTLLVGTTGLGDEGVATLPSPTIRPVSVLRDTACDVGQSIETGEDFEGMLVGVQDVTIVRRTHGFSFLVRGATDADTIEIVGDDSTDTFQVRAIPGTHLNVQGILVYRDGAFRIAPRDSADLQTLTVPVVPTTGTYAVLILIGLLAATGASWLLRVRGRGF